jgi:uncharacterized protein (DUF1330 family)
MERRCEAVVKDQHPESDDPNVVVTQLVYVRPGHEEQFHEFEDHVLPLLAKHGGELLLRVRPPPSAVIGGSVAAPYEVHVVRFASRAALASYGADPERRDVLRLKDESVRETIVIEGVRTV